MQRLTGALLLAAWGCRACPFSGAAHRRGAGAGSRQLLDAAAGQGSGPQPYRAATTPDGHPDLDVILNHKGAHAALSESFHRLGATLDSVLAWVHNALPGFIHALGPVEGAQPNLVPGSIQAIHDSMALANEQVHLAAEYTFLNLPLIAVDHLAESLYSLEQACKALHLDKPYKTAFQVLLLTIPPGTYGLALRLSFHDSASYDPNAPAGKPKGGANGSIRYEFDWPSNGGLQRFIWPGIYAARQILDLVLPGNTVSYADLVAIAGTVGVFQTKGPLVNVGYGRPDAVEADPFTGVGSDTNEARDYPITELLYEWNKFGFNATELVVLSGGHSIGIAASTNPQGKLSGKGSLHFGKLYYENVLNGLGFFGSDKALGNDPGTRALCEKLAASDQAFFGYWGPIFTRLTMLGVDPSLDLHTPRY